MAHADNIFPHLCSRRLLCPCHAATSGFGDMHLDFVFFSAFFFCVAPGSSGSPCDRIFVDLIFSLPRFRWGVKTRIFWRCMRTFEAFVRFFNSQFRILNTVNSSDRKIVIAKKNRDFFREYF